MDKIEHLSRHPKFIVREAARRPAETGPHSEIANLPAPRKRRRKKSFDFTMAAATTLGVVAVICAGKATWDAITTQNSFAAASDAAKADSVRHGMAHTALTGIDQATHKKFEREVPLEEALVPNGHGRLKKDYVYELNRR